MTGLDRSADTSALGSFATGALKSIRETQEAGSAATQDLPAELADVLEVLRALVLVTGMTWDQLLVLATDKRAQRGGFDERLFLLYVDEAESARDPSDRLSRTATRLRPHESYEVGGVVEPAS